ncbi:MAG: enoyl-CoA hydratase/isomerase family protein [Flavobacteriales bacterium]|nr:enoyl-CoA hydratase/isomerase family protein [Flavobacteriales bacterium]
MPYQFIGQVLENHILTLVIQRPEQLNALNRDTIEELNKALALADANDAVRCIIVTGAGDKAFVAGADIKEFADFNVQQATLLSATGHKLLFDFIENMSKPVIAAINGFALGGGLELALACHMRVASEQAKLGLPETSLGVIPGYGGTQRLMHLAGKGKAIEMISNAGMITAAEALQWGIVNYVVPAADLMTKCQEMAQKIVRCSPTAIAAALRAISAGSSFQRKGMEAEIREFGRVFGSEDQREGVAAFLEKRKPVFTGK